MFVIHGDEFSFVSILEEDPRAPRLQVERAAHEPHGKHSDVGAEAGG